MTHNEQRNTHEPVLPNLDPPSSPPTTYLLATRKIMQVTARIVNKTTLNPRAPAGT